MKQKHGWRNESQFRKDFMQVMRLAKIEPFRIEAAPGSTPGLPDLILRSENTLIYVELKCLNPNKDFEPINRAQPRAIKLSKIVSRKQKEVLNSLAHCAPTYVAAAHKGTLEFSLLKVIPVECNSVVGRVNPVGAMLFTDDGDSQHGTNFGGTIELFKTSYLFNSMDELQRQADAKKKHDEAMGW